MSSVSKDDYTLFVIISYVNDGTRTNYTYL